MATVERDIKTEAAAIAAALLERVRDMRAQDEEEDEAAAWQRAAIESEE